MTAEANVEPNRSEGRGQLVRMGLVLAVGVAWLGILALEVSWANGPWYWKWPWRSLGWARGAALLAPPMVLVLAAAWRSSRLTSPREAVAWAALLAVANFGFQISGMLLEDKGFDYLRRIVESPVATNYYGEAAEMGSVRGYLSTFHTRDLGIHTGTHPPGPVLIYRAWILIAGPSRAVVGAALFQGLLGSLGVLVMYGFASLWTEAPRERLTACVLYALLPGLVVFFPEFDQVYPLLSMTLIQGTIRAFDGRRGWIAVTGVALFIASLLAYNLLMLGILAILEAGRRLLGPQGKVHVSRICTAAAGVLAVGVGLHLLFHLGTGYDPIGSFQNALRHQKKVDAVYACPYYATIFFCPYDLFLAAGFLTLPLLALSLRRCYAERSWAAAPAAMTLVGLTTLALINVSGTLYTETARLWLFLQPLVLVPCGLELARWPRIHLLAVVLLQWGILVATKVKLIFIWP